MIPLLNKPSIQHLVENLVSSGLDEIVITLGYQGEKIEEYFGDGSLFGANIKYVYEEKKLGTAGSVKNAQDYLDGDTFLGSRWGSRIGLQSQADMRFSQEKRFYRDNRTRLHG
jgi:Nucleoside-diphosphate-sugar pyrophosphorylase involved in lipopolysaccharide biosynthesis/translation initiation factor 2B, gamma/epsilon subunits (eIF-2Bgamma/eIF-2Bepsilon)